MANSGAEYALEIENKHLRAAIAELGGTINEISLKQAFAENIVRALKNQDMMVNGGSVTMERVQIMETGEIRLQPPMPAPITDRCVKEPQKNGQKPKESSKESSDELANVSPS